MKFFSKGGGESQVLEQIVALEKAMDDVRRDQKAIRLDWEMALDKLGRMMGRLNARIRKNLDQEAPTSDDLPTTEGMAPAQMGNHQKLRMARAKWGR